MARFLMKRNIIYILIFITIITIGSFFYLSKHETLETLQKCPDDYVKTNDGDEEYKKDMDKWTNDFFDLNPGATLDDWGKARYQFWVDNKCEAALKRYAEGLEGKDPTKMELINNTINETINGKTQ